MSKKPKTQKEIEAARKARIAKRNRISQELRQRTIGYVLASFGLVAGLAWNDAITSGIESLYPVQSNSIYAKFLYALIMTAVIVMLTIYLASLIDGNGKEKK
jgi:hypothetical protein